MNEDQEIPLGHIFNIVSGFPFATTGGLGIASLIRYMAQYPLPDFAVRSVWPVARISMLRQHGGWLQHIEMPKDAMTRGSWPTIWAWLDTMEQRWGARHTTSPASVPDWASMGLSAPSYTDNMGQPLRVAFQEPVIRFV